MVDKAEVQELIHLPFSDGGLVAIIKLLKTLDHREARLAAVQLNPLALAVAQFVIHQLLCKIAGRTVHCALRSPARIPALRLYW